MLVYEHLDMLTAMGNLTFMLELRSRNKEAILLVEKYCQLRKQILGRYYLGTESLPKTLNE